jgi:hypothetical protein
MPSWVAIPIALIIVGLLWLYVQWIDPDDLGGWEG